MRRQYYYIINSLPSLVFGVLPPLRSKDFLDRSQGELKGKDFSILASVGLLQTEMESASLKVLRSWYGWEADMRNNLVSLRAAKLGLDPKEYRKNGTTDPSSLRLAEEVFQTESPSAAEEKLDKARWMFLEELETGHYFDIERLVIYSLKLQILERRSLFDEKKGGERRDDVIGQVDKVWSKEGKGDFFNA